MKVAECGADFTELMAISFSSPSSACSKVKRKKTGAGVRLRIQHGFRATSKSTNTYLSVVAIIASSVSFAEDVVALVIVPSTGLVSEIARSKVLFFRMDSPMLQWNQQVVSVVVNVIAFRHPECSSHSSPYRQDCQSD